MLYREIIAVCSQIHTKHKLTTGLQRTNRTRITYSCTSKSLREGEAYKVRAHNDVRVCVLPVGHLSVVAKFSRI